MIQLFIFLVLAAVFMKVSYLSCALIVLIVTVYIGCLNRGLVIVIIIHLTHAASSSSSIHRSVIV